MTIVCNNKFGRRGDDGDGSGFTLHGILDDVDKHLLEKDGIKMNGNGFVGKMEVHLDVCLRT